MLRHIHLFYGFKEFKEFEEFEERIVVLYAITGVDLYVAFVINPCYTECKNAVGDAKSLDLIFLKTCR